MPAATGAGPGTAVCTLPHATAQDRMLRKFPNMRSAAVLREPQQLHPWAVGLASWADRLALLPCPADMPTSAPGLRCCPALQHAHERTWLALLPCPADTSTSASLAHMKSSIVDSTSGTDSDESDAVSASTERLSPHMSAHNST
eukprot:366093-Chlamydomonas_euryale.AAC.15